jgi:hypothetical protein
MAKPSAALTNASNVEQGKESREAKNRDHHLRFTTTDPSPPIKSSRARAHARLRAAHASDVGQNDSPG